VRGSVIRTAVRLDLIDASPAQAAGVFAHEDRPQETVGRDQGIAEQAIAGQVADPGRDRGRALDQLPVGYMASIESGIRKPVMLTKAGMMDTRKNSTIAD
jgi:hypothetical protein